MALRVPLYELSMLKSVFKDSGHFDCCQSTDQMRTPQSGALYSITQAV